VDLFKCAVHHIHQKFFFGRIDGIDRFFADVQLLGHLLHGKPQPLLPEQQHRLCTHQRAEIVLHPSTSFGN